MLRQEQVTGVRVDVERIFSQPEEFLVHIYVLDPRRDGSEVQPDYRKVLEPCLVEF